MGRRLVVPCSVAAGSALPPMTVRSRPRGLPNGLGRRSSTRAASRRGGSCTTTLGRCVRSARGRSDGSIQERLRYAASINLGPAHPKDIPYDDLRKIFAGIKDDLSFEPATDKEGSIAATLAITNDEDAQAIARRILDLYLELNDRLKRKS